MTCEETKAIILKIQSEKRNGDSDDLRGALKIFAEQLNTEATHFIWELIQNAEDNEYKVDPQELQLLIDTADPTKTPGADGCLIARNNESGFQERHVRGICSVGRSSKSRTESPDYIGEKGIGFKSVFRVSDSPHIFSNGFQFRFSKPRNPIELGYIVPEWVEDIPTQVVNGWTTILLPLKPGVITSVAEQLAKIPPESILFLRKLKRLELGDGNVFSRSDTESNVVLLHCSIGESQYFLHVRSFAISSADADSSRAGISKTTITIAFPLKSPSPCRGRIFAFLPTRLDTGLPFLVNADFILNSNREGLLEDRRWNQALRNSISEAFVEAFMALLENTDGRRVAHGFVPVSSDINSSAEFFASIISPIQSALQSKQCILTKDGDFVFPEHAFLAGELANKVLRDVPRSRGAVRLLHPEWECDWEKRLKPLGVKPLNFTQLFDACNEPAWLKGRDAEWWKTLYLLCSERKVSKETIANFPLLPCQDGNCRPINSIVCFKDEGQVIPTSLPGPGVTLFDVNIQAHLQTHHPAVWQWLKEISGLRQFTIRSYISDQLLDWLPNQSAELLLDATRFIAENLEEFLDESPLHIHRMRRRRQLREKMPWMLADGNVLRSEQRGIKSLATPEILEGDEGWNVLFPALNRHFFVISDSYCSGLADKSLEAMCRLFSTCGATQFPSPSERVTNGQRDWSAPGWLLGLDSAGQNENIGRKIKALERWLNKKGFEELKQYLVCHSVNNANQWQQSSTPSEFGLALKVKPWLRTSVGPVVPHIACIKSPELEDFFGSSAAYVEADLPQEFLEKLGVKTHLTADVLITRLRQMSSATNPDIEFVQKIYRRLQDTTFDCDIFKTERLIFLSYPRPHWRLAAELVWSDAGELFDHEFGYLELTYGNHSQSELRRFFSDKLGVPELPRLEQYALAWQMLCNTEAADPSLVEKKLKIIFTRMTESQGELPNYDWWLRVKPNLKIWTTAGRFVAPSDTYVPDDLLAIEIFKAADSVSVAYLPKVSSHSLNFLRQIMGCKSLAETVEPRISEINGENRPTEHRFLTAAAKELIVLLICNKPGWQNHRPNLEHLLQTIEVGAEEIIVNYSLRDNIDAGTRSRPNDSYWNKQNHRLLLLEGVDQETLRDAAAKSIAAQFFGDSKSSDTEAEFFKLLMATPARAKKIKSEHAGWSLNAAQEAWLREQNWQTVLIDIDAEEPPAISRANQPAPVQASTSTTPPVATTAVGKSAQSKARSELSKPSGGSGTSGIESFERRKLPDEQSKQDKPLISQPKVECLPEVSKPAVIFGERRHRINRSSPEPRPSQGAKKTDRPEDIARRQAEQDEKNKVERAGIDSAKRHLLQVEKYTEVIEMGQNSPGFDLLARRSNEELRVELKSHKSTATAVVLTKPEWDEYQRCQKTKQAWELWNIENALSNTPIITRYNSIPGSAVMPRQYQLNLADCFHTEKHGAP